MTGDYIFVSYSHKDEEWLERLRIFLKPFPWGQSATSVGRSDCADPAPREAQPCRHPEQHCPAPGQPAAGLRAATASPAGWIPAPKVRNPR